MLSLYSKAEKKDKFRTCFSWADVGQVVADLTILRWSGSCRPGLCAGVLKIPILEVRMECFVLDR